MPESENKKRGKRPTVSIPKPDSRSDDSTDESSLYGDEADIPTRRPRKKKKDTGGEGEKKSKGGEKKRVKAPRIKTKRKKKKTGARRTLFEMMSATGSDSFFKPLKLFGHDIRFWPLFALGLIALLAVGVMLNNSNLTVAEQTVTIVGLPEELETFRVVVLSDMNGRRFGDSQSLLLRTVNALDYDFLFCLGDMVGPGGNAEPFYELLEGVRDPSKVYFICGDSDPGPFVTTPRNITGTLSQIILEDWILGAVERGANYVDAPIQLPIKNANVWISPATLLNFETVSTLDFWKEQAEQEVDGVISGIAADYNSLPKTDYRYQQMQKLYDAERAMSENDIHIALSHERPSDEFIYTSEDHRSDERYLPSPDLVLAGHYCNGVWRVPFYGALYAPDDTLPRSGWLPEQSAICGLSTVSETQLYITGGLSNNAALKLMPFRLFNSPQISVLTLTSTLPENMLEAG